MYALNAHNVVCQIYFNFKNLGERRAQILSIIGWKFFFADPIATIPVVS